MAIKISLMQAVALNKPVKHAKQKQAKPQTKKVTPRIIAIQIFSQLLKQQGSLASLLPQHTSDLSGQDQGFVKELCYGCCRWYPTLNEVLNQLLRQKLKPKDADIKAIILLGLYQLAFLRTADYAAINESVNAVAVVKKPWAKKLVNAVLRNFQRDQKHLFDKAKEKSKTNHPLWLATEIKKAWPNYAEAIFTANNQLPPLTLRVNQQQYSREQYQQLLRDADIEVALAPISQDGLYLQSPVPVTSLPSFSEGAVSVQDEAGQLAATLLQLKPEQRVLDACCAPGGKTCHIGEMEPKLSHIVAVDLEERRLKRVHENLARLNIHAEVICGDAATPKQWWDGQAFDRILLDAPCSATGIIRRQPDIKLLREPEHIQTLTQLQYSLLCELWPLLVDGGILLYATCSILPQENTKVIERFLANTSDAAIDPIVFNTDNRAQSSDTPVFGIEQPFGRQLLPLSIGSEAGTMSAQHHDGFYYCRLKKIKK